MWNYLKTSVRKHNYNNNMSGWIYMDSLIGIIVLVTALIAIVLLYTQVTKGTVFNIDRVQALYVAQDVLEYLKFNDGKTVGETYSGEKTYPNFSYKSFETRNGIQYNISTNQLAVVNKVYTVQVTVMWKDIASSTNNNRIQLLSYYYLQ